MKLNTKRNILSDFSGKLSGNLKKNKNQGTSILSDFKLTGSLIIKSVMVIFLVVYLGRLYVSDTQQTYPWTKYLLPLNRFPVLRTLVSQGFPVFAVFIRLMRMT